MAWLIGYKYTYMYVCLRSYVCRSVHHNIQCTSWLSLLTLDKHPWGISWHGRRHRSRLPTLPQCQREERLASPGGSPVPLGVHQCKGHCPHPTSRLAWGRQRRRRGPPGHRPWQDPTWPGCLVTHLLWQWKKRDVCKFFMIGSSVFANFSVCTCNHVLGKHDTQ